MNNTIKYKGFTARVEYSADDEVFIGRVIGVDGSPAVLTTIWRRVDRGWKIYSYRIDTP